MARLIITQLDWYLIPVTGPGYPTPCHSQGLTKSLNMLYPIGPFFLSGIFSIPPKKAPATPPLPQLTFVAEIYCSNQR